MLLLLAIVRDIVAAFSETAASMLDILVLMLIMLMLIDEVLAEVLMAYLVTLAVLTLID